VDHYGQPDHQRETSFWSLTQLLDRTVERCDVLILLGRQIHSALPVALCCLSPSSTFGKTLKSQTHASLANRQVLKFIPLKANSQLIDIDLDQIQRSRAAASASSSSSKVVSVLRTQQIIEAELFL